MAPSLPQKNSQPSIALFKLDIDVIRLLMPEFHYSAQDSDIIEMDTVQKSFLKSPRDSNVQVGLRTTDNESYVANTGL